jgi:hypothetical protein
VKRLSCILLFSSGISMMIDALTHPNVYTFQIGMAIFGGATYLLAEDFK